MANDIKLQSPNGTHPVDENLRPILVGDKLTSIETAQHGDGARVIGDLMVTGDIIGNIVLKDVTLDSLTTNSIISTNLTIDDSGDITLDADGGEIYLKDGGTTFGTFSTAGAYSELYLYEDGGASADDYFRIRVKANGETDLTTVDAAGAVGHITLNAAGLIVLNPTGNYISAKKPLKIKESAGAAPDDAAYGQIWVKDETPNELYFTTDAGDDIQLTDGTSSAGGVLTKVDVTISEAEMDALHTTEKELIAAQGANMVIVPVSFIMHVDADGSTTQTGTGDMRIGYTGTDALGEVWISIRRFMWNEGGDRVINAMGGPYTAPEPAQGITTMGNRNLTAKMSAAITSGSIDSIKCSILYYLYDQS